MWSCNGKKVSSNIFLIQCTPQRSMEHYLDSMSVYQPSEQRRTHPISLMASGPVPSIKNISGSSSLNYFLVAVSFSETFEN